MAEEVYYCSDDDKGANGFRKNKQTGQYERAGFTGEKFKMKLQDDGNITIANEYSDPRYNTKSLYLCSTPFDGFYGMGKNKSCVYKKHSGEHFNFNQDDGKYVRFSGTGYVFDKDDDVSIQIGTCTKF